MDMGEGSEYVFAIPGVVLISLQCHLSKDAVSDPSILHSKLHLIFLPASFSLMVPSGILYIHLLTACLCPIGQNLNGHNGNFVLFILHAQCQEQRLE